MKQAVMKTKKIFAVLLCVFMLSSLALPLAGAEGTSVTEEILTVPKETEGTITENISKAEMTGATYSICSDTLGTPLVSTEICLADDTKPEVTIKNSLKDTVLANNNNYAVYLFAKTETVTKYVKLVIKNFDVSVSFYDNDNELLNTVKVVYGGSVEEAAEEAAKEVEGYYNKYYHYLFGGWVVDDENSTLEKVVSDTKFTARLQWGYHDYNEEIERKEPTTCTENGSKTLKCICGRTKTEEIPAAHTFDTENEEHPYVKTEPTCTEKGSESGYCTACKEVVDVVLPALGHDMVTDKEMRVATCTDDGWSSSKHCKRCEYKEESETIPKMGHKLVEYGAVEQEICTEEGYEAGIGCSRCPYIEKEPTLIPAKEHQWRTVEAKAATCTEDGNTAGTICEVCGYSETVETNKAPGHDWEIDKAAQPATCLTAGWTEGKHCKNCTEKVESKDEPATGHTEVIDPNTDATCTEPAKTEGKHCSVCGETLVAQQTIGEAEDHKWAVVASAVPATCTEHGKTETKKCMNCDARIEPEETALLPHEYEIVEGKSDVAATCTEAGLEAERKCKYCDAKLEEKVLPALGHIDEDNDNKCERCGGEVVHIDPSANCSCICHSNNVFKKFLWSKILLPIIKFLGVEKTCKCTVTHWSK